METTTSIEAGIDRVEERMNGTEQDRLLQKLKRAPASFESAKRSAKEGCFEGTRAGLLKQIDEWLASEKDTTKPVFWLQGIAGIGKSTVAHTVAKRCQEAGSLGGTFFFDRQDGECSDPFLVFTTLARQLADSDSAYSAAIAEAVRSGGDTDKTVRAQMTDYLVKPLVCAGQGERRLVLVLDAFDECREVNKVGPGTLLQLCTELCAVVAKESVTVRMLVTSRPLSETKDLQKAIDSQANRFVMQWDIEQQVAQEDIRRYLAYKLGELRPNWPSEEVLEQLVLRAGNLFVYAQTVLDFVSEDGEDSCEERLDVLQRTTADMLLEPYNQLDSLYVTVLEQVIPTGDSQQLASMSKLFRSVIGGMMLTSYQVPLDVLIRLVGVESQTIVVKKMVKQLASVIVPPRGSIVGGFHSWHASFSDFLLDRNRCRDDRFFVGQSIGHAELALHCLRQLKRLHFNMCDLVDLSEDYIDDQDRQRKARTHIPEEVAYACVHWATHLSKFVAMNATEANQEVEILDRRPSCKQLDPLSIVGPLHSRDSYAHGTSQQGID